MKIIIGADIVPKQINERYFIEKNVQHLIGDELIEILSGADFRIFNLETPLTDNETPIEKSGPCLIAKSQTADGIKAIGVDLVTIANNHILDMGEEGLKSTINKLDEVGIAHVGAGNNLAEASKPYFITIDNKKIGVFACVEHEFSIATESSMGANPIDWLETPDQVRAAKEQCDYLIVLYHGGREHYRYPSPNLQKVCRKLVEKGADIVICQHSHCIGCEEKYLDKTIVYGQGNFIFAGHDYIECWKTGLLVEINTEGGVNYIPLEHIAETVRLAKGTQAQEIIGGFNKRSEEIKNPLTLQEKFDNLAESEDAYYYLFRLSGIKRTFMHKVLNKLSGGRYEKRKLAKVLDKNTLLEFKNYFKCEAHNELIVKSLENRKVKK